MKACFVLLGLLIFVLPSFSQNSYLKLKVYTGSSGMQFFNDAKAYPESGFLKKDGWFTGEFSYQNYIKLKQQQVPIEVLIDNLEQYSKTKPADEKAITYHPCFNRAKTYPHVMGMSFGSMGGYYTLSEAMAELDTMIALYPSIISQKVQIGISIEGRPIYAIKISDNPHVDENEPRVLYTAIHHSQEPASLQQLIHFMYFLLENYGSNSEVTYLVNNTELYFIPVINPDGYEYNRTNNPNGGGMHRKNRRTTWFSDGVDLNRNYSYMFAYDELGSSSIGYHPWFRGDSAFSEPESRAVKDFVSSKGISIQLNWHAYGNLIIYPWNYDNLQTAHREFYAELSRSMTYQNNYLYGTVHETYGYQSNGDADDWSYGDTISKTRCYSLTAEIGTMDDGFWPNISRIFDLCKATIWTNLSLAHHAHAYYRLDDFTSALIPLGNGYFKYQFVSTGLKDPASFTLTFIPITTNISFPNPVKQYSSVSHMHSLLDSVYYVLSATGNETVKFVVQVNNGTYVFSDTITKQAGWLITLVDDPCETLQNWTGTAWNISNQQTFSGMYSITESPNGNYSIFQSSSLELNQPVDLSTVTDAMVNFMMKYDTENNYDYVQLLASPDNGTTWYPLCGRNSKIGSDDEEPGQPVWHGLQKDWMFEEVSLNDFLGQIVKLKFYFYSDQTNTFDGFYFDNFKIVLRTNTMHNSVVNASSVLVYPNPASDKLYLYSSANNESYEITDITGRQVSSFVKTESKHSIDVSRWSRGVYFLKNKQTAVVSKFVVY